MLRWIMISRKKVTFEERFKTCKKLGTVKTWGRSSPGRGKSKAEGWEGAGKVGRKLGKGKVVARGKFLQFYIESVIPWKHLSTGNFHGINF